MANRVVEIFVRVKDEATNIFHGLGEAIRGGAKELFSFSSAMEAFVSGKILEGFAHLVEMFAETEMTITRLNAALQVSGRYTREGSEEIQRMAVTMQNLTTVSREAALEISATVGALARELTPKQLADVQKAAIGLSETFGISLERAASLIGRTLEGSFNALHRYGIEVDLSSDQQGRFNELMGKMAPLFEISVEATNTLAGRIEQVKNQFRELERTTGEIIARFLGLNEHSRRLADQFRNLNKEIRERAGDIVNALDVWVDRFKLIGEVVRALFELIRGLFGAMANSGPLVESFGHAVWESIKAAATGRLADTGSIWKHFSIAATADIGLMTDAMEPFQAAWDKVSATWDDIQSRIGDPNRQKDMRDRFRLPALGAQERGDEHNVGERQFDTSQAVMHETAVVKDLIVSQRLLNQERIAGRGHTSEYVLEQNRVVLSLMNERHQIELLLERNDLEFKQRTELKALIDQINNSLHRLSTQGLDDASDKTKELVAAEANLEIEYKSGLKTQADYLVGRANIRKALEAEIAIIKAMIFSGQLNDKEVAEATKLLNDLTAALIKAGGAAKAFKDRMKEALGAGTTEPIKEVTDSIVDSAKRWEDAWTKSAGAAMAAGHTSLKGIGKAIQQAAKVEEAMALADALKYLAHAAFDTFFNPGAAVKDLEAAGLATASAAAYALIAGGGGGSGGGSGGGGGGSAGANATSQAVSNLANGVTIIVPPGLTNSQAWVEELVDNIAQAGERRVTIRQGQ